jgi:hypothetical protein
MIQQLAYCKAPLARPETSKRHKASTTRRTTPAAGSWAVAVAVLLLLLLLPPCVHLVLRVSAVGGLRIHRSSSVRAGRGGLLLLLLTVPLLLLLLG